MQYSNSQEIVTFINKAQNKVAELTTIMVARKNHDHVDLCIQLLDFIESLDNEWCPWTEDEISIMMQYYNSVADLNNIPFLEVVGYKTNVILGTGSVGSSNPIYTSQIVDYVSATKALIAQTKHNELKEIQGGKIGEYYHLTQSQLTKLLALITTAPTVGIRLISSIPTATNGVYEKGTSLNSFIVQGSVVLNDGGVHTESRYLVAGKLEKTLVGTDVLNAYQHSTPVKDTTVVKFQALFTESPMKEANLTLRFEVPYFSAVDYANKSASNLVLTKGLAPKGAITITFTIDSGNAMSSTPKFPYVLFPASWGLIKSIGEASSTFDYKDSFKYRGTISKNLADGTPDSFNFYEYGTATEGTFTFTFRF